MIELEMLGDSVKCIQNCSISMQTPVITYRVKEKQIERGLCLTENT